MFEQITLAILPFSDRLLKICAIGIVALVVIVITDLLFAKVIYPNAPTKRAKTLLTSFENIVKAVVFIVAVILCLTVFHVNITPILASAGILGLAIGFGAQVLVKDILSGIFFIFENQFNAGDEVKIGDIRGRVEHVGLRTISVRDTSGALYILPNSSVDKLANLTSRWSSAVILVTVSVNNDVDAVVKILEDCAQQVASSQTHKDFVTQEPKVYALDDLLDAKMTFKVVIKTQPGKQEAVAQHFRYLTKKAFDREKIAFL